MEFLAPIILGLLVAATSVTATIMTFRGGRANAQESRAPTVNAAWAEADRVRSVWYRLWELFHELRRAFKSYAGRVQSGGSTELTAEERAALEQEPPALEKETP